MQSTVSTGFRHAALLSAAVTLACTVAPLAMAQTGPANLAPANLATAPQVLGTSSSDAGRQSLKLQLGGPLAVQSQASLTADGQQGGLVLAASSLKYQLNEQLSLAGGAALEEQATHFRSLGSIHCENGTLDAVSYRASNCHFIDDPSTIRASTLSVGGRYQVSEAASASLNLFQVRNSASNPYRPGSDARLASSLDPLQRGNSMTSPLFSVLNPGYGAGAGLPGVNSELTGIDVQFQVGLSTDSAGDLVVGLQLTRILEGGAQGGFYALPGMQNWTLSEPVDSANLNLDWNLGAFSGGIQSYYRSTVEFLNRTAVDEQASFDVHFTWRAPWNASVSVGASNILNAGTKNTGPANNSISDPLESIYGRIPYVRYKQDL